MAALTSALFVALFASSWLFVLCQGTQEVKETVKAGEDVTLQCQSHRGVNITVIAWSRTDLKPVDGYIFFFRNDGLTRLSESYPGRVELRDPKMKDRDASVILKNLKTNDTGTYQCWIKEGNNPRRSKRDTEPELFTTIKLTVTDGHKEGNVGLMVGLPVVAVLLVAVVGTMLFKKRRGETPHTGGKTSHTGGETPHTGGETPHTGGETDALNPPTSG